MEEKHIFIIENSFFNTNTLKDILKERNYKLSLASDGQEALAKIKKIKPDLILLDVILPDMNGFDLCRKFKKNKKVKEVPVIFISSLGKNVDITKGFAAGGIDYITELFQKDIVLARIETHINLYRTKKELQKKNEQQNILLENIDTQIWYLEDINTYGKVNKAHADFIGYQKNELEGKSYNQFFGEKEKKSCIQGNKKVFTEKKKIETDEWVRNYQGEKRLLAITKTPKLDKNGNVEYVVASAEDITEKRIEEEKIRYLSFHDELTKLYNRRYFENEMKKLDTKRQLPISIIIADINGLKIINDSLGHEKGDQLLIKSANILKELIRDEDILARQGGDEFAILLPQTTQKEAEKIINRIKKKTIKTKADELPVSIALGTASKTKPSQNINSIFKKADDNMYQNKLSESKSTKSKIVKSLLNTLESKSDETKEHAVRMTKLAIEFGKRLELSNSQLHRLSLLATLHDIGKTTIPEDILKKPDRLTDREWEIIKEHPGRGYKIANSSEEFALVAEEIYSHHERWDSTGYPRKLKEKEIPYLSRIISIIDAYDVMTNGRPYKNAISKKEAAAEIKSCAGSQFDPNLANVFIEMVG
jgi:diguanylate cyclase (GGDEF)-like protein/PAS domain S-box-containing protein